MKLIVGLGNPGKEYKNTRHNIGFMVLDRVSKELGFSFTKDVKKKCEIAQTMIGGQKVIFIKPTTYMNLSGDSLRVVMDYYDIDVDDILVICDDLDMPTGKVRFRKSGSSGGHNGLKSIIANIKTQDFKRMKVGIDRSQNIIDYVLGDFSKQEKELIDNVLDISANIINDFIKLDFASLMSKYN